MRQELRGEFASVLPIAYPSKGIELSTPALSRRSSGKSAPCTMAKSACVESPRAARLRPAQRCVMSSASRAAASFAVEGMHWSSTIMMSLPMAFCVSMLTSGLSRIVRPSIRLRKAAPSSVITRDSGSEKI